MALLWGLKATLWATGQQAWRVLRSYRCHLLYLVMGMQSFIDQERRE